MLQHFIPLRCFQQAATWLQIRAILEATSAPSHLLLLPVTQHHAARHPHPPPLTRTKLLLKVTGTCGGMKKCMCAVFLTALKITECSMNSLQTHQELFGEGLLIFHAQLPVQLLL